MEPIAIETELPFHTNPYITDFPAVSNRQVTSPVSQYSLYTSHEVSRMAYNFSNDEISQFITSYRDPRHVVVSSLFAHNYEPQRPWPMYVPLLCFPGRSWWSTTTSGLPLFLGAAWMYIQPHRDNTYDILKSKPFLPSPLPVLYCYCSATIYKAYSDY